MDPRVRGVMAAQHGLITRSQAIAAGMVPEVIDRLARCGDWVAVRRGVYAEAEVVAAHVGFRQQRLLADRAACLRITRPHVRSHDSAAHELDLPILQPSRPMTHVTRPGVVGSHLRHGVKHHLAPYAPERLVAVNGFTMHGPARVSLDIAREHGLRAGVVAIDSARRDGVTLRELVTGLGRGRPQTQFGLSADGRTAWCDLRLGRHLFEFDGRLKYQRVDEGGVSLAPAGEVVWREKRRQDWLCGFKLGMSRVVWDDLFGAAREATRRRLEREYLDTCRLYGESIADLTPYLARGPRPRPGRYAA